MFYRLKLDPEIADSVFAKKKYDSEVHNELLDMELGILPAKNNRIYGFIADSDSGTVESIDFISNGSGMNLVSPAVQNFFILNYPGLVFWFDTIIETNNGSISNYKLMCFLSRSSDLIDPEKSRYSMALSSRYVRYAVYKKDCMKNYSYVVNNDYPIHILVSLEAANKFMEENFTGYALAEVEISD